MDGIKRLRPSPAMIVAIIALVLSLGGTSYAAITLPAGSVGTKQLRNNAVTGAKVKDGALTTADISAKSLSSLSRVAMGSGSVTLDPGATGTVATVSLTAPKRGFVLVTGYIDEDSGTGLFGMKVWDDTALTSSPWYNGQTMSSDGDSSASNTAVFPVPAGPRTFSVRVSWNNSSTYMNAYGTITALFVPYGANGSPTALGKVKGQLLAPPQRAQP